MAKKTIKKEFTVKLDHCGNSYAYGNIDTLKNTNAAELIEQAVIIMAKEMVGSDNNIDVQLSYSVGLKLLKDTISEEDFEKLQKTFP